VSVPAGTPPSQYLAGITAKPAQAPSATNIGGNQQTSVNAIIIHEITIGVAISTGNLAQLTSKLVITGVSGSLFGTVSRLLVTVKNEGQRYAHGSGTAVCTVSGQQKSLPVNVNTVLPGESATVPVNAGEFGTASHCVVQLDYGVAAAAAWTGSVKIPVAAPAHLVPVAKGVYAALPPAKLPHWAVALLIAAGAVLLLVLVMLLLAYRRRRARGVKSEPHSKDGALSGGQHQAQVAVDTHEAARLDLASLATANPSSSQPVSGAVEGSIGAVVTETLTEPASSDDLEDTLKDKAVKGSSKKKSAKGSSKKSR
jgi:archaellum component FlaF (FlaF/FlaG flagellin family)